MTEDSNAVAATTRFPPSEFEAIENWRRAQRKIPALAETLRILVKRGLESERRSATRERKKVDIAGAG